MVQLGNGTTTSSSAAQDVQNLKDVVQVVGAQNGHFGAAVRTDGTVWAWGLNTYGQLGNSKNENSWIPVSVGYFPTTNFDIQYAEVQKSETGTTYTNMKILQCREACRAVKQSLKMNSLL